MKNKKKGDDCVRGQLPSPFKASMTTWLYQRSIAFFEKIAVYFHLLSMMK